MNLAANAEPIAGAARWQRAAIVAALLLGIASLVYGAVHYSQAIRPVWQPDGWRAAIYALGAAAGAAALAYWRRWPAGVVAPLGFVLVAASAVGPGPVAVVLLVCATALQIGFALLPRDGGQPRLHVTLAFAVGLALMMAVVQGTARLKIHLPIVYLGAMASLLVGLAPYTRDRWQTFRELLTQAQPRAHRDVGNVLLIAIAFGGVVLRFIGALAPEVGLDALDMHVVVPAILARDHIWSPEASGFLWAWMPLGGEWAFSLAFISGGEAAARLLNFAVDVAILLMCSQAARTWAGARAGAVASVLYAALPVGYLLTTSLFVENVWTLWLVGALALMTGLRLQTRVALGTECIALGLLLGAAVATKVMTVFWAPLVAWWLWAQWRNGRTTTRGILMLAVPALLIGAWPYIAAWVETGNPMFPFMNQVFQSPRLPFKEIVETPYGRGLTPASLFQVTFQTDRFLEAVPGAFGIALLVLLPAGLVGALLSSSRWAIALVVWSLVVVALSFHFTAYVRYLAPVFPLWAALAAGGFARADSRVYRWAITPLVVATGVAGLALFANSTWGYRGLPPLAPIVPTRYAAWTDVMRPEARIVRRSNELGLRNVLWFGRGFYAGLDARIATGSWHQKTELWTMNSHAQLAAWVAKQGFDGVVLAEGVDICNTLLCAAADDLGEPDTVSGGARIYRIVPGVLRALKPQGSAKPAFALERMKDPELLGTTPGWSGSGEWDRANGTMRVTSDRLFSQSIQVVPGRSYQYRIKARCVGKPGLYRAQVNWLRGDGTLVAPMIETHACKADWVETTVPLQAPAEAETAVVYAVGHDTGVSIEVDSVSLRE